MLNLFNYLKPFAAERMKKLVRKEEGQTMVEYVMLIVLVALAVFLLSPSVTQAIMSVFTNTSSALSHPPTLGS